MPLVNFLPRPRQTDLGDHLVIIEAQTGAKPEKSSSSKMLLLILDRRGITISEEARERIRTCTDIAVLESWADRAFTVTSADELFA
jgi:hypothetical protein